MKRRRPQNLDLNVSELGWRAATAIHTLKTSESPFAATFRRQKNGAWLLRGRCRVLGVVMGVWPHNAHCCCRFTAKNTDCTPILHVHIHIVEKTDNTINDE